MVGHLALLFLGVICVIFGRCLCYLGGGTRSELMFAQGLLSVEGGTGGVEAKTSKEEAANASSTRAPAKLTSTCKQHIQRHTNNHDAHVTLSRIEHHTCVNLRPCAVLTTTVLSLGAITPRSRSFVRAASATPVILLIFGGK